MASPSEDAVLGRLAGATLAGTLLTTAANLFTGPPRAAGTQGVPDAAVFVLATGGPPPQGSFGQTEKLLTHRVQVVVRGAPGDYTSAGDVARAVCTRLHDFVPAGWLYARAQESEPLYMGEDEAGRHEWSTNVELLRHV